MLAFARPRRHAATTAAAMRVMLVVDVVLGFLVLESERLHFSYQPHAHIQRRFPHVYTRISPIPKIFMTRFRSAVSLDLLKLVGVWRGCV